MFNCSILTQRNFTKKYVYIFGCKVFKKHLNIIRKLICIKKYPVVITLSVILSLPQEHYAKLRVNYKYEISLVLHN